MSSTKCAVGIQRLEPGDDRAGFRSGSIEFDRFFQRYAGQNRFRYHIGNATPYVATQKDRIAGFVTVSGGEMLTEKLRKACVDASPPTLCRSFGSPDWPWTKDFRGMALDVFYSAPCLNSHWKCGTASAALM